MQGRVRPLLVKPKGKHENLRGEMLRNAKKLRNTTKEQLKKIIITPDMTVKEREISRKLREDLRIRREAGEENLVIRRGKIVNRIQDDTT